MNIVYCVTGSVAEKLSYKIIKKLEENGHTVYSVFTETSLHFPKYENKGRKYFHSNLNMEDEVREYYEQNKVWHVDVANWGDILLIAPCTANTIGKIVNGICDTPQLSLITAFLGTGKKVYVAPVMNTNMYNNPFVQKNIYYLSEISHIIDPTVKELACGDFGIGAMPDIDAIVDIINDYHWGFPLESWNEDAIYCGNDDRFYTYLPRYNEPGSFGAIRKYDIHTGVDIYCKNGEHVLAVEDGKVIAKGIFTGGKANSEWWNETGYVVVRGKSGDVLYGEIDEKKVEVGNEIKKGSYISDVKQVLPDNKKRKDIRNHKVSMLHIELYKNFESCVVWNLNEKRNKNLLDPTPYLKNCRI